MVRLVSCAMAGASFALAMWQVGNEQWPWVAYNAAMFVWFAAYVFRREARP